MIEMHSNGPEVGVDPYLESDDYRSGMAIAQGEHLIELLRALDVNIERLSTYTIRQLSRISPKAIDLGPLSGKQIVGTAVTFQTTQRFRVSNILFGGGLAADRFQFTIGAFSYNFFSTGALTSFPFEIEIDRGIDISIADITTPANVAWTFVIFGYPE